MTLKPVARIYVTSEKFASVRLFPENFVPLVSDYETPDGERHYQLDEP